MHWISQVQHLKFTCHYLLPSHRPGSTGSSYRIGMYTLIHVIIYRLVKLSVVDTFFKNLINNSITGTTNSQTYCLPVL